MACPPAKSGHLFMSMLEIAWRQGELSSIHDAVATDSTSGVHNESLSTQH